MDRPSFFATPFGRVSSAVLITFLWGSPFPIIKLSYQALDIGPTEIWEQTLFAGYRFFFASIVILLLLFCLRKQLIVNRQDYFPLWKVGLFQTFIQYLFLYIGLGITSGIVVSLIAGTGPLWQMIFAHFMYTNDRLTQRKVSAILIGFMGVIFIYVPSLSNLSPFGWGEVFVLVSAIAGAFGNILVKNESRHFDVILLTGYQMLFGSIGLLLIGAYHVGLFPFAFSGYTIGMLCYLIFVSAVAFLLWNALLKHNRVSQVSIFLCLIPVFGVLASWWVLDESLNINIMFALWMVVIGIYLMNRQTGERK